jgi:hypothetical protein
MARLISRQLRQLIVPKEVGMEWRGLPIGFSAMVLLLSACAEGRWVHPTNTDAQSQQDWDECKTEVLSGQEHRKDTMAGGINLSGCMQSKGYRYVEDLSPRQTDSQSPAQR